MTTITILFVLALSICCTIAQDYDYESAPRRQAPARIQPGYSGSVEPQRPTPAAPISILKQINRQNEDGSYTYGYEGADGSFKIETKSNNGEVKGKYGYVDGEGKLRVVEYGANKYGFQPAGEGITVPPPTLVEEPEPVKEEPEYFRPAPKAPRPRPEARPQYQKYRPEQPEQEAPRQQYQDYSVPSPVPQRPLSIQGAQPSGVVYSERPKAYKAPTNPERFAPQFANGRPVQFEPQPAPVTQQFEEFSFGNFQQSPAPAPQRPQPIHYAQLPVQQQRASAPRSNGGSILDQLQKDYALPSNGAPALHDITFGAGF